MSDGLTKDERHQLRAAFDSWRMEKTYAVVESIVAARTAALTAERDDALARLDVAAIHYVAQESDMSVDICNHMALEEALAKLDRWEKVAMDVTTYLEREEEDDRRSISTLCFAMACARKAIDEVLLGIEG